MTVAQIIELLQRHPQELRVVVDGCEGGFEDIYPDGVCEIAIFLDYRAAGPLYLGPHEEVQGREHEAKGRQQETALLLSRLL